MNIPIETKPALWGAVGGAVALAIFGFNWGGWVTGGKAETMATTRADEAVVGALAPLCVGRFELAGDAAANREALKKTDAWAQGDYVEKGGWAGTANVPAGRLTAVARACAALLIKT